MLELGKLFGRRVFKMTILSVKIKEKLVNMKDLVLS
jgi:hypothetical protein